RVYDETPADCDAEALGGPRRADGVLLPVFGPTPRSLFRLRVDGLEEATATATLALNTRSFDGPAQDMCRTTTTMEGSWDGSSLRFDGDSLEVPVGQGSYSGFPGDLTPDPSVVVELRNWSLELVIHPDGDAATLDSMSFDVDTRDLIYFVVPSSCPSAGDGTPLNFCRGLESFGVACTACSDGLETCVDGLFAGAAAPLADDLVDVEADQRENHLCADACDNAIDDDEDGDQDTDEECEPAAWP
ncbi:MAG: hypothetical protein KDA24_28140, partial [Deltaproteobacteria bacterium]|nr:hypothetical protein [Deltaproteobacteria bacterium]